MYSWNFGELWRFGWLWLEGARITLYLTVLIILAGTVVAVLLAGAIRSRITVLRLMARAYIDLFRAIPALVLLGTIYFCLPMIISVRISPFQTAFIALTLNLAPFAAECVRAAIESIPTIQYDSATVLGISGWQRKRFITGPQVVRAAIPSLMGQYITTLKLTSLAASIGVGELWNVTSQVTTATSLPLESRFVGAALYIALVLPFIWMSQLVERKLNIKGLGPISER